MKQKLRFEAKRKLQISKVRNLQRYEVWLRQEAVKRGDGVCGERTKR